MAEKITQETTVTLSELAVVLGLSSKRIRQMVEDGIMHPSGKNEYPLAACVHSYQRFLRLQMPSEEDTKLEKARRKAEITLKASKAEIAKLEAAELQGKMHRSEDVAAMTEDLIYSIRGMLTALPGRVAVDAQAAQSSAEAEEIVREQVFLIMEELSHYEYDPERYEERVRARMNWEYGEGGSRDDEGI